MKKKDISTLILIGSITAMFALVISNAIFGSSSTSKRNLRAEVVQKIDGNFPDPKSTTYLPFFNPKALNPTQQIQIGDGNPNTKPLNATTR
jgi:hypothetical protein